MIRRAKFQDIPQLVALGREVHATSKLADVAELNVGSLKRALSQSMMGPDEPTWGSIYPLVNVNEDKSIDGAIIGAMMPLYQCLDVLVCTHIYWYSKPGAPAYTGTKLMKALHDWAKRWPGKLILQHGVSDTFVDPKRSGRIMERQGFKVVGTLYEKEINLCQVH